jgi:hypothetical protein
MGAARAMAFLLQQGTSREAEETAIAIELNDVLANTVLDTIRLSTIAPNDLEVIEALKLLPLLRRQPFA